MVDRDTIIKGCENWIKYHNGEDLTLEFNAVEELLSVLKEQDDLGAELTNAVELIHKKNERIKELLKEQEAVPVIQREVMHMLVWCCGSCGVAITNGDKFCRMCGKKMKWNA